MGFKGTIMRYIIAFVLTSTATAACSAWAADGTEGSTVSNTLVINADKAGATINKNIYGHFAEHLGRCIYDGIWVGPESSIPNTRGIRNDIVAALRDIKVPVIRWPGGCFADIYHWTEVLMRKATERKGRGRDLRMDGLSMHYYCDSGRKRREATQFNFEDWFYQFKKALRMEEMLDNHIEIMDKYDPGNKIGLIVDEWGCWHHPIAGTNPDFLCQQNTLHDALASGVNLNLFNQRCRRVKMANIAQMVNVLQSVILTQGEKMILTPTYYTFKMYAVHQGATLLPTELSCHDYTYGDKKLPSVSVSASKDSGGRTHITLCNIDPENPVTLNCWLEGAAKRVTGQILTHEDMNAHNTFDDPEAIKPAVFEGAKLNGKQLTVTLPAKSIVVLEIK